MFLKYFDDRTCEEARKSVLWSKKMLIALFFLNYS